MDGEEDHVDQESPGAIEEEENQMENGSAEGGESPDDPELAQMSMEGGDEPPEEGEEPPEEGEGEEEEPHEGGDMEEAEEEKKASE